MKKQRYFDPASESFAELLLFENAESEAVCDILGRSPVVRAEPGETVLAANTPNDTIYVVMKGTLRVDVAAGESEVADKHLGRGECAGELSVIDGTSTSASVLAVDQCELLAIDGAQVLLLADRSHAVARNLLRILSRRIRGTNTMLREEVQHSKALRRIAASDALTGLYSRGWLDETVARMAARADHEGSTFAVLLADVDHFKSFNDRWGHLMGDRVLQQVGEALRDALRPTDFAARYGGEEFAVVLPGVSDVESAAEVAERLRCAVRKIVLMSERGAQPPGVTISLGVAVRARGEPPMALFERADQALYRAKHAGRDCIETA
jgi:diguanylate cyclase (GGDEF)-like protein